MITDKNNQKVTVGETLSEISTEKGRNIESDMVKFGNKFGSDKLKIAVDTVVEISELKEKLAKEVDTNFEGNDETYPAYFNKLKSRKKAEEEIGKLPEISRVIEDTEKIKDLRKLNMETLIKLESQYEGILMYAFTDKINEDRSEEKIDFANWKGYSEPKAGTKLLVNFHDNQDAERNLGAADMFPPCIRKITVYGNGKSENARTSEKRMGLKGRNKDHEGFFDKQGYIPVFTTDIVIIGGEQEPEKNIDYNFAAQFLNNMGKLDETSYEKYKTSEEAKKDESFVKKLGEENPKFQKGKAISAEEISGIMEHVETTGSGKKVIEVGLKILSGEMERYVPESCGDWVRNVYKQAGVKEKIVWHNYSYYKPGNDKLSSDEEENMINIIQPGDWLWYFNNNGAGLGRDGESLGKIWENAHAVIFVEWIDKEKRIAKIMNANGGKAPTSTGTVDLSGAKEGVTYEEMCKGDKKNNIRAKRPITKIGKPQFK